MFVIWVAIVVMAVVITVAKEFIDKKAMGRWATLAWSALVIAVASAGGIFTVTRAISSERKLADVNAKYAHRRLTDAQKLALKEGLSEHPPPASPIQIHSVSGDPESASFGIDLAQAISAAGWPAEHENMAFFGAPHGLQIRFPGDVRVPVDVPDTDQVSCPACMVLARGLERAGQQTKVMMWPPTIAGSTPDGPIELVVGYKPLMRD